MVMEIGEKFKLIVIFNKHAPNDQGKLSIFLICLLAINVLCRNVCWSLGDFWGRYFYCFIVEVLRHVLDLYLSLDTRLQVFSPAVRRIVFYSLAISLDAIPL